MLDPILLKNLNYNAQVGVLGHELSHVCDFNSKNFGGILRIVFGNLSDAFLDRFEFYTDKICIDHGLGYQLLAWSENVRDSLKMEKWIGTKKLKHPEQKRERYMKPETILKVIAESPVYRK